MVIRKKKIRRTLRFAGELLATGCLLAAVSYQAVPALARFESDGGFCLLWLLSMAAGLIATPRHRYDSSAILGIALIPLTLDLFMAFYGEYFYGVLTVCFLCICGYLAAAVCTFRRFSGKWLQLVQHHLFRCRQIASLILACCLVLLGTVSLLREEPETAVSQDRYYAILETMDQQSDLVSRLDENLWKAASSQERLTILQHILNLECRYLGIPYPLTVTLEDMDNDSIHGSYAHGSRTVYINREVFHQASAEYLLSILLHEVYHSFQHALIDLLDVTEEPFRDLLIFDKAAIYTYESSHYISGSEDFSAYYNQHMEADSRAYSALRCQDYLDVLTYLSQTG